MSRKPDGYWNYDNCYQEALKYKSRGEFRKKNSPVYYKSLNNKWINDYTWFVVLQKPNGYWNNYDRCYKEALKYSSKSEFKRFCSNGYHFAKTNNWINDYTWFKKRNTLEKSIYCIYSYEDADNKSAYIGLSNNLKRRHYEHSIRDNNDSVYTYFASIGKEIPEPTILIRDINPSTAQEAEGFYVNLYKWKGYNIINRTKTGSLGGVFEKWNYDTCYKEALKYKCRNEFKKTNQSAYNKAKINKWIDDYTWFVPRFVWDYETCYKEALKYKSRTEFCKNASGSYNAAIRHKWLDEFFPIKKTKN